MQIELSIREYLISHGISQAFVARKIGISKQKLNGILNGRQEIKAMELKAVCEAVGVPFDYFYNAAKTVQDSA